MKAEQANTASAELWGGYLATQYEVKLESGDWLPLTVGSEAIGLGSCWQGGAEAFIITAHNPHSQRLPPSENLLREAALLQYVRDQSWRFLPTKAIDVTSNPSEKWPDESGVLIFGATIAAAIQLAAEFQQYAIVRVPRVGVVECLPVNADGKCQKAP